MKNIMNNKCYKVLKLEHLKGLDYEVTILDESGLTQVLAVHEEIVLKYRLVAGKELDEAIYEELQSKLDLGRAYQYALNLLSRKSYTTAEIYQKLELKEYESLMIKEVLERLTNVGLLNDEQYAISYISHHSIMGKKGPAGISQDLLKKGVSSRLIDKHLKLYDDDTQLENAMKLATQVLKTNTKYGPHFIKQKVSQHLMNKGFSRFVIEKAINQIEFEDEDSDQRILVKEMEKLFRRHQALSGYDKKVKIVNALMRKGFNYDDISSSYQQLIQQEE